MTKKCTLTKKWNYALLTENVRYKCSDNFWREVLLFMITYARQHDTNIFSNTNYYCSAGLPRGSSTQLGF